MYVTRRSERELNLYSKYKSPGNKFPTFELMLSNKNSAGFFIATVIIWGRILLTPVSTDGRGRRLGMGTMLCVHITPINVSNLILFRNTKDLSRFPYSFIAVVEYLHL